MYDRLYYHPEQLAAAAKAKQVTAGLFAAYRADPALMGADWLARMPQADPQASRHIADFIAGMTDRFAIAQYAALYGSAPEGLSNV
jgi:dGTPase